MYGTTQTAEQRLEALVAYAEQHQAQLPAGALEEVRRIAGVQRPQTITITLRATGDTNQVNGQGHRVETALADLARQAGLTIERGSTVVRVG